MKYATHMYLWMVLDCAWCIYYVCVCITNSSSSISHKNHIIGSVT